MTTVLEQFEEHRTKPTKLNSTDDQRSLDTAFDALWKQHTALNPKLFAPSQDKQTREAQALLNGEMRGDLEQASAALTTLAQIYKFGAHRSNEASDGLHANALKLIPGAGAVMMTVVATVTARRFTRGVQRQRGVEPDTV